MFVYGGSLIVQGASTIWSLFSSVKNQPTSGVIWTLIQK
jgi:hypothetical protein